MTPPALRLSAASSLLLLAACSSASSPAGPLDSGSLDSAITDSGGGDSHVTPGDGGTISIGTGGYDVACQKSSDCVLVETGQWSPSDPCCGNGCPGAAINVADQSKYGMALSQVQAECAAARDGAAIGCGLDCIAVEAYCSAGTCAVCTGAGCAADAGGGASDAGDGGMHEAAAD